MGNLDSLDQLLQEELKAIYDAEKQLTKALPRLARKASAGELKEAFQEHLRQTKQHVDRLEQVFEQLGMPARGNKCEGMKYLIAEGEEMIGQADDAARDAIMIAAAQKIEHYEIASYGTVRTWANLLGKNDVAAILEDTLEEEKQSDQKLTGIAESFVNQAAAESEAESEKEQERPGARGRPTRGRAASTVRNVRQSAADRRGRSAKRGR